MEPQNNGHVAGNQRFWLVCLGCQDLRNPFTGERRTLREVWKIEKSTGEKVETQVIACEEHPNSIPKSRGEVIRSNLCECNHTEIPYHTTPGGRCFACGMVGRYCERFRAKMEVPRG